MTALASTPQEWGQLFLGVGSTLGVLLASMKWMFHVQEKRAKQRHTIAEQKQARVMTDWLTAKISENLIRIASQAGPARTRVIDMVFTDTSVKLGIPVVLDQWMALPWGLWVCGVDFNRKSTGYLIKCDTTSRLLTHTHEGSEMVQVIQGTMEDLNTGKRYEAGDMWVIPASAPHMVHFDAPKDDRSFIAMVVVTPALPDPRQSPINLTGLARLIDPETT